MAIFRSILYNILCQPIGILLIIASGLSPFFGQNAVIFMARRWAAWHGWCAKWLLGIEIILEGSLDQGQALYVFKHESYFESIQTLVLFDRPVVVMKQELLDLPFWGFAAKRHGSIGVNREAGPAAMRAMIASVKVAKDSGRSIILFPEGTRIAPGERPPVRAGLAGLYKILGLPVIPVALSSGKQWPKGIIKYPGKVMMKVGDPIPPGLSREEIEEKVHAAINALNV